MGWRRSSTRRALLATTLIACGSAKLPSPPYTGHPTAALQPVPYPPPPANVESVPERPAEDAVWIDGEWIWQTRRWAWRHGRWVRPVAGARYAPWTSVRDENGSLFVAAGTWRGAHGEVIAEPGLPTMTEDVPAASASAVPALADASADDGDASP